MNEPRQGKHVRPSRFTPQNFLTNVAPQQAGFIDELMESPLHWASNPPIILTILLHARYPPYRPSASWNASKICFRTLSISAGGSDEPIYVMDVGRTPRWMRFNRDYYWRHVCGESAPSVSAGEMGIVFGIGGVSLCVPTAA